MANVTTDTSGVPDAGSSFALLSIAVASLLGLRRKMSA